LTLDDENTIDSSDKKDSNSEFKKPQKKVFVNKREKQGQNSDEKEVR
jgi:hypothetical protein